MAHLDGLKGMADGVGDGSGRAATMWEAGLGYVAKGRRTIDSSSGRERARRCGALRSGRVVLAPLAPAASPLGWRESVPAGHDGMVRSCPPLSPLAANVASRCPGNARRAGRGLNATAMRLATPRRARWPPRNVVSSLNASPSASLTTGRRAVKRTAHATLVAPGRLGPEPHARCCCWCRNNRQIDGLQRCELPEPGNLPPPHRLHRYVDSASAVGGRSTDLLRRALQKVRGRRRGQRVSRDSGFSAPRRDPTNKNPPQGEVNAMRAAAAAADRIPLV